MAPAAGDIAEPLGTFLGGVVDDLRRLSGGASRETFAFTLMKQGATERVPLILQRVRSGTAAGGFSMVSEA